jgi:uncharacterized membrane protein
MEWLGLATWVIVAAIALPLGRHALDETPTLGVQALAGVGGLALSVVFLAAGRLSAVAWGAVALGAIGTASIVAAALWLASDRRSVSRAGQGAEEIDALLAAIVGPLFAGAAMFSLFMALGVGMVG